MSNAMENAAKGGSYWSKVSSQLVEQAYKEPVHTDESTRISAAESFEDRAYALQQLVGAG